MVPKSDFEGSGPWTINVIGLSRHHTQDKRQRTNLSSIQFASLKPDYVTRRGHTRA